MEKEFVPYEITLLPTDKPSRLYEFGGQIILTNEPTVDLRVINYIMEVFVINVKKLNL